MFRTKSKNYYNHKWNMYGQHCLLVVVNLNMIQLNLSSVHSKLNHQHLLVLLISFRILFINWIVKINMIFGFQLNWYLICHLCQQYKVILINKSYYNTMQWNYIIIYLSVCILLYDCVYIHICMHTHTFIYMYVCNIYVHKHPILF